MVRNFKILGQDALLRFLSREFFFNTFVRKFETIILKNPRFSASNPLKSVLNLVRRSLKIFSKILATILNQQVLEIYLKNTFLAQEVFEDVFKKPSQKVLVHVKLSPELNQELRKLDLNLIKNIITF